MHEKYDVEKCGEFGGGGEYVPQVLLYHFNYYDPWVLYSVFFLIGIKWSEFAPTDLYLFLYVAIADWFWVVKWTCIGILGGVWMASRQKNRLLRVCGIIGWNYRTTCIGVFRKKNKAYLSWIWGMTRLEE
jgi:hypothetical protein